MQIACPTCATRYEVSASSIGAAGRSVRCARCRALWFAAPAPPDGPDAPGSVDQAVAAFKAELDGEAPLETTEAPSSTATEFADSPSDGPSVDELMAAGTADATNDTPPAPDIETAAAAASLADHPVDLANHPVDLDAGRPPIVIDETPTDVPSLPAGPAPADGGAEIESLGAHRQRHQGRRLPPSKTRSRNLMPVAIVVLFALIAALIGWRGEIVRRAPQMASLYSAIGMPVNLRKLVFADVRMTRATHDGVSVILIQGTIVSISPTPTEMPRLRFAVRNEAGAELYSWTAQPSQPKLAPFEALAFQSRVASPPGDGRDIVVRFFNRRDTVASVR